MIWFSRFCAALVIVSCFLPVAWAAPTVLPVSSSAVAVVPATDTFTFARGAGTTTLGASFTLTGPGGQRATVTQNTMTGTGGAQVWRLDGTQVSGTVGVWTWSGSLAGVPADGTWEVDFNGQPNYESKDFCSGSSCPGLTLTIGGKSAKWGINAGSYMNYPQAWNWRSTGVGATWSEPSTTSTTAECLPSPCFQDTQTEAAQEDPNNAVFFQAAGAPFIARTLHYTVSCTAVPTMTVNGAWAGGDGTTLFSQFIYRDGPFVGEADLRNVPGFSLTTEENEGASASGTDSKSVAYNNAAGTSYQFRVRTAAQGETLGDVLLAPPAICTPAAPGGSILFAKTAGLDLSVSQAQCANDPVSFASDVDISALITVGDLQVTVFNAGSGLEVATFDDAQMFTQNAGQIYYFQSFFASGSYMAVAQADLVGVGAVDLYESEAFSVPVGDCIWLPTDLGPILEAISALNLTVNLAGNITFSGNSTFTGSINGTVDLQFPGGIDEPGLYWWLELVFWLAVFYFCWYFNAWATLAFAIGGSLHLVNPAWFFGLAQSIPWVGLTAFVELLVHRHRSQSPKSGVKG